mmetsp:Transcript_19631/g.47519  ORF Transcript_19631/g.47519 Transcript_19631/m.47519 type:complete len:228 (-) Transcript_19631:712-1395(-)
MSILLVPASTTISVWGVNPSISTSSWFNVFSRSSLPPPPNPPLPRLRPTASISSMKMIDGVSLRAFSNRSRTREGPTPTNISTKSLPLMEKKGTPASPATAFASKVFPVPGGPTRIPPLGIFAPNFLYFSGLLKKSTNSLTSTLACFRPATSANFVVDFTSACVFTLALPIEKMLPPPPGRPPPAPLDIIRIMSTRLPINRMEGRALRMSSAQILSLTYCTGMNSPG